MPANSTARYVVERKTWKVEVSTADTTRDGSGSIATLVTAGTFGTLIELVRVVSQAATTKGMLRMFLNDGSTWDLYKEYPVFESAPTLDRRVTVVTDPLGVFVLPSGWIMGFSTQVGDVFNAFAHGGDY